MECKFQKEKKFKVNRFTHNLKVTFIFNFLHLSVEGDMFGKNQWSKQSYLLTSREDLREGHTILAYCFINSVSSCVYPFNCPVIPHLEVVYHRFFQFWLISQTKISSHAQKDIISTDADITHTLPLRKKRFFISENFFRT